MLGDRLLVVRQRLVDDGDLVREGSTLHAGPGPRPVRTAAAEQGGAERSRRRGVGDAHFTQTQHVDAGLGRHHAVGHGVGRPGLAHRRPLREVEGRICEVELVDAQIGVDRRGELVDGGPAG